MDMLGVLSVVIVPRVESRRPWSLPRYPSHEMSGAEAAPTGPQLYREFQGA